MISVVFAMLRARRSQAVTLALLAMFATAAAVAAPAYLRASDRAIVAGEIALASPAERGVTLTTIERTGQQDPQAPDFAHVASALLAGAGFTEVYGGQYSVLGLSPDPHVAGQLTYRQDICAHLRIVAGRCLIGTGEVLVGAATAARLHVTPGQGVTLTFAEASSDPRIPYFLPAGRPMTVTVAGLYRPGQATEAYWGTGAYFAADPSGAAQEPLFTNGATFTALDHSTAFLSLDATAGRGTVTLDRIPALRRQLADIKTRAAGLGGGITVGTQLPDLLTRIDRSRTLAHQVIPVAGVPLVLLAWFVIFLAAGYGADGRRGELGLVALRGIRLPTRWWLAAGESLVSVLTGCLAGLLAGEFIVGALAAWRLPVAGTGLAGVPPAGYALGATAGAVLAALLGQVRALFRPVADLLRWAPGGRGGWRPIAAELAVVALAVAAAAQLRASSGSLTGIGLLAPALVILGLALLWARALNPLAGWYAARSLRRGRIGPALAALDLARRPGARRLLVVLVAATALLGFASAAVNVATRSRAVRAQVSTGAARVLTVGPMTRTELLQAVRATDPGGRYAMAVVALPPGAPGQPPVLAVDSTRLAAVADWRSGSDAAQVAARLHPGAPPPILLRGQDVALDVTIAEAPTDDPPDLALTLASTAGQEGAIVDFGVMRDGVQTFQQRVPACLAGCRLIGLHVTGHGHFSVSLILRALRLTAPDVSVVSAAQFAAAAHWRVAPSATLAAVPGGLRVDLHPEYATVSDGWVQPVDIPYPLPVATTTSLPAKTSLGTGATIAGLDKLPVAVTPIATLPTLPRVGTSGELVDLEYAERAATDAGPAKAPQVWLGSAAPPDVLSRLRAHGLIVVDDQRATSVRHELDQQGPALALWFQLVCGGFAIVLAGGAVRLVGSVDRRRRAGELAALRNQGVSRRAVGRGAVGAGPVVAITGVAAGTLSALLAWWVAGPRLPVFVDGPGPWPLPTWPTLPAVLLPAAVSAVFLLTVALALGYGLRREVDRG